MAGQESHEQPRRSGRAHRKATALQEIEDEEARVAARSAAPSAQRRGASAGASTRRGASVSASRGRRGRGGGVAPAKSPFPATPAPPARHVRFEEDKTRPKSHKRQASRSLGHLSDVRKKLFQAEAAAHESVILWWGGVMWEISVASSAKSLPNYACN